MKISGSNFVFLSARSSATSPSQSPKSSSLPPFILQICLPYRVGESDLVKRGSKTLASRLSLGNNGEITGNPLSVEIGQEIAFSGLVVRRRSQEVRHLSSIPASPTTERGKHSSGLWFCISSVIQRVIVGHWHPPGAVKSLGIGSCHSTLAHCYDDA